MKSVLVGICILIALSVEINLISIVEADRIQTSHKVEVAAVITSSTTYKVLWDNDEQSLLFKSFDKESAVKYYLDYKNNHDMLFMVDANGVEWRVFEKDFVNLK